MKQNILKFILVCISCIATVTGIVLLV